MLKLNPKKLLYVFINLITIAIFMIIYKNTVDDSQSRVMLLGRICLAQFVVGLCVYKFFVGKWITFYSLFMLSFFTFQCGQIVLFGLGVDYNYFYIRQFNISTIENVAMYSFLCNCALFLGGAFHKYNGIDDWRIIRRIDLLNEKGIFSIASNTVRIFLLYEIPSCLYRFSIVIKSGYSGVRDFEGKIPSILVLVDILFPAFCILCIVYGYNSKKRVYSIILVIWSAINALMGDRTSGIAGIMIFALSYLRGEYIRNVKKKISGRRTLSFSVIGIIAVYLIGIAGKFRSQSFGLNSVGGILRTVFETIGELGFSFVPLACIYEIYPLRQGYLYGKSIIGALVSGMIPSSVDLLGIIRPLYYLSLEPREVIDIYKNYSFGVGFSLNAESYSNFGNMGVIWIFVLCAFIARILSSIESSKSKFSQYIGYSLLFGWFTMPRRSCYYFTNYIFWYVVLVFLLLTMTVMRDRNKDNSMFIINEGDHNYNENY